MPSPLPHTEITKALARLAFLANEMDDQYRWGHMLGYVKRTGGDSVSVTTSGTSNPTRQIVKDKAAKRIRENMCEASDEIIRATKSMELALSAIGRAYKVAAAVQKISDEPLLGEPIRKTEFRVAAKAKGRRMERGEGWGEG